MNVLGRLRRSRWLQRWRSGPVIILYAVAKVVRRPRPGSVLMLSDSRSTLSGNLQFIAEELVRQDPRRAPTTVLNPRLRMISPVREMLTLPFRIAATESVVLDDYYPRIYALRVRPQTRVIQAWHAAGAFKRVGFSRAGRPGGPIPRSNIHRGYTDTIASSQEVRPHLAEAFAMPVADVHAIGIPRTDVFFDADLVERTARDIRERHGVPQGRRVVLFAPTFRGNGQFTAHYDYSLVDWEELGRRLGDEHVVLVKMHPFVREAFPVPSTGTFVDVSSEREINDLLMAADVVVTDYSSLIFEFALLSRPVVMFVPDLADYERDRSFYRPFEDYVFGPVARTSEELIEGIRSGVVDPERHAAFIERFMSACDGHSSRRFVDVLLSDPRRADQR